MASSIHIKKATGGIVLHNSRENFSNSVVFVDEVNECSHSSKEAYSIYRNELATRSEAYTNRTNQKLQSKAITHLSAVVNLNQHHTLKDLIPIQKYLEENFDTKVFQMSIHRDEGKLVSKEDEKEIYTSGEDFFMNPENSQLYWDKKYTQKIDLSKYEIVKNYHAHIEFMGLDSKGEAIKRNYLSKFQLSNLQTFVAKELQMERGKNYYAQNIKAPKRLDVLEFKRENKNTREKTLELAYKHKEYQAKITSLENVENSLKKELHGLNNEIAKIKSDDELKSKKIEQLKQRINILETSLSFCLKPDQKQELAKEKDSIAQAEQAAQMLKSNFVEFKNEVAANKLIVHNQTETAQKLAETEKTIQSLVNQKADVVADNIALKEQVQELTQTISVKSKVLNEDEKQKKSLLDHFKAPQNTQFWGFFRQKINSFIAQIKELKAENSKLKEENQFITNCFNGQIESGKEKDAKLTEKDQKIEELKKIVDYPGVADFYRDKVLQQISNNQNNHRQMER